MGFGPRLDIGTGPDSSRGEVRHGGREIIVRTRYRVDTLSGDPEHVGDFGDAHEMVSHVSIDLPGP